MERDGRHVEFFDELEEANFRQEGPDLHHFCSSPINMEQELYSKFAGRNAYKIR